MRINRLRLVPDDDIVKRICMKTFKFGLWFRISLKCNPGGLLSNIDKLVNLWRLGAEQEISH